MRRTRFRQALAATAALSALTLLASCSSAPSGGSDSPSGGAQLTMWARNTSNNLAEDVVKQYNATHPNQVELTIVPSDAYQTKVAAAAASGGLPDILASDVVYSPNYVKQGLYQDITDRVRQLSFYDDLAKAHINAASRDDKLYGTPFIVDSSIILYNKDLYEKAGLDPEQGPSSYADILADAKAIREKVGGDTYGFYFGGNCFGCNAYTMFGNLAAADQAPLTDDGTTANFDTPAMKATLDLYKQLWDSGAVAPSAKAEDGANWNTLFNQGKIGILPRGTGNYANLKDAPFDWGVAGLPAPDGSKTSAFIGGDVAGISSSSKNVDAAWDFLSWTLEEDNQVEVIAKAGSLPSRIDLAENQYSAADDRVVQAIKGQATGYTPSSTGYGNAINNPNGPWLKMVRDYVFNGDPDAISAGQQAIQASLDSAQ